MKADHHVILVFIALDVFAHFVQSLIQAEALQQGQHQFKVIAIAGTDNTI